MNWKNYWWRRRTACAAVLFAVAGAAWMGRSGEARAADGDPAQLAAGFNKSVKPFFAAHCVRCHNVDTAMAGVRVDQLDASLEDRHLKMWEAIRHRVQDGSMPPKGQAQPSAAERQEVVAWANKAIEIARLRPAPKNGMVRRLTIAQYRNTLRELLKLEDDLTEPLPPDAISRDGFVNNKETLQLSPLLLEAYLEIADEALSRSIVDVTKKPAVQNFRMDLGESINPAPLKEELILGANSLLLENKDFTVTQLTAKKPFPIEPFFMKTKYRFIEGYQGNDTVRGWREYDSIYHSVFACMRGSGGYPKGKAYAAAPEGLLLRPAIPNDEIFEGDGTYGPKANFKISLRELPDYGRFRVTVTAAKYNDGLLLDAGAKAAGGEGALTARPENGAATVTVPRAGVYQVDVYEGPKAAPPAPADASKLSEGLAGKWPAQGEATSVALVDSPFGKAYSLKADSEEVKGARPAVGTGEFSVAGWIHPRALRKSGLVTAGGSGWTHGWALELGGDGRGMLRLETTGPDGMPNGTVTSPAGVIRPNAWQHVAAVVKRGKGGARLYVNGYLVARGDVGTADLDNRKLELTLGRTPGGPAFRGELGDLRFYTRAIGESEIQALVQPGREFAKAPPERPAEVTLSLASRRFTGTLQQAAFLAVRLPAGELKIDARTTGVTGVDRVVLTPVEAGTELAERFATFEKRVPRLGVHLGLRRDCGSTFSQVGTARDVNSEQPEKFVFEGAIRNFPSPDVEKDNVNYLAGVREIAVRSEYSDGRDMPRLAIKSVEFEGPFYESWPPVTHKNIFIDSPRKGEPAAYAREIIRSFATRAYRRPVTASEEAALMAVFSKSLAARGNLQSSVKDALQVVLTSPQFLFLVETSQTPAPEPLNDYELASKLSYFLWNGPPDRTTLGLAASGTLRAKLDGEVNRMIADSKFAQFTKEFVSQWLALDKFQVLEADRKRYPKLTRDARAHLRQEPIHFVEYLIRNNLPVKNLIDSDFVMADETVAGYYDLGPKTEKGFAFVPVSHGRKDLGGVLTQAAILAGLSDGRESNPVKRGAWLARKIVAEPPNDPPPNVPALKEDPGTELTLRQRLEQHRNQTGCQQCHTKIDPWGVALEEYDAGGRRKTKPADARSVLPDKTEVSGAEELRKYLSQDRVDQVAFSVLKHLSIYGTGRSLTYAELHFLKQDALRLKAGGYRMKDLVRYVVNSKLFLEK